MFAIKRFAGAAALLFTGSLFATAAAAAVLTVGPGKMYAQPAGAAAHAKSGDTIKIFPGTYHGAVWTKPNLTIIGMGGGPTITGPVLKGKGLFVIDGANITVKNIAFKGAKNGAGNGAGLRVENTGLTVVNSRFWGNQNGILTNNNVHFTLSVTGSQFGGNGSCAGSGCAHAIYAGHIASLTVTNSTFNNTKAGHHIKSRANQTVITGNTITDGPKGTSSYLIDVPNGGGVTITGNTLEKGPKSKNYSIAISLGEEGASNPAGPMLIAGNKFRNDGRPTTFVFNRTGQAGLVLSNNVLTGNKTTVLKGKGSVQNAAAMANSRRMAAVAVTKVPEPGTLVLFGAALLMLGLLLTPTQAAADLWKRGTGL